MLFDHEAKQLRGHFVMMGWEIKRNVEVADLNLKGTSCSGERAEFANNPPATHP